MMNTREQAGSVRWLKQARDEPSKSAPFVRCCCPDLRVCPFPFRRRRYAIDRNAPVVSNDRFRDHAANGETLGMYVLLAFFFVDVRSSLECKRRLFWFASGICCMFEL